MKNFFPSTCLLSRLILVAGLAVSGCTTTSPPDTGEEITPDKEEATEATDLGGDAGGENGAEQEFSGNSGADDFSANSFAQEDFGSNSFAQDGQESNNLFAQNQDQGNGFGFADEQSNATGPQGQNEGGPDAGSFLQSDGAMASELTNVGDTGTAASLAPPSEGPSTFASPVAAGGGVVSGIAGGAMGPGLPEPGSKMAYFVVAGDTLGRIAKKIYGSADRWHQLAELSGIKQPNLIYPGDVIYYQLESASQNFASRYENLPKRTVAVTGTRSLPEIAREMWGKSEDWSVLWRLNGHITNPDHVTEGTEIIGYTTESLQCLRSTDCLQATTSDHLESFASHRFERQIRLALQHS